MLAWLALVALGQDIDTELVRERLRAEIMRTHYREAVSWHPTLIGASMLTGAAVSVGMAVAPMAASGEVADVLEAPLAVGIGTGLVGGLLLGAGLDMRARAREDRRALEARLGL